MSGAGRGDLAKRLAEEHGLNVLAVPDVYDLPVGHAVCAALAELEGPVVVAAEYYPRAVYWTAIAGGLHGLRGDRPQSNSEGQVVYPVDLTSLDDETAIREILSATGDCSGQGTHRDLRQPLSRRWYPVIDYDRCINCFDCVEFCLFGVYEMDADNKVHVAEPDSCKPGCPACSRVCPAGAIIFPRYAGRGPIAGADEGRPDHLTGQAARQAGGEDVRAHALGDATGRDHLKVREGLDKAIDELERFET
ncbi:MAG: ferredoxin family protein [Planctomycetes bacterium]|nr:ferredoxin family protein [Planctomycetota bacterium]